MNKDLMRVGQTYVATSEPGEFRKDAGAALIKTGMGGLILGGGAWLLPFITLPMLLVAAVVIGLMLYVKS